MEVTVKLVTYVGGAKGSIVGCPVNIEKKTEILLKKKRTKQKKQANELVLTYQLLSLPALNIKLSKSLAADLELRGAYF